ncbi:GNAT family N-acetyltransferase [Glaciecola sp. 2405UD65-10]|uniref:GNAT family N-acetyltransferase n=1 Tax=Glaciecola sp. 2405UD65-10 TaxID=3397244 RepID=UPI003B5AD3AD
MSICEFTLWLKKYRQSPHHRTLVNLSLPDKEAALYLNCVAEQYSNIVLFSTTYSTELLKQVPIEACPQHQIKQHLGTQLDAIVFDARQGIDLTALYSATGLVRHAGIIIVLCPLNMPNKPEEYKPIPFSYGDEHTQANFLRKYYQSLLVADLPLIEQERCYLPAPVEITKRIVKSDNTDILLSDEQEKIRREIIEHVGSECKHVILGSRGRGKSTLLGNIAFNIQHHLGYEVIVSAPNKRQIDAMQNHYNALIENANLPNQTLHFIPPDQCCDLASKQYVLIVDEMASIAPALLRAMLVNYKTVILAGTTAGYEGSGQGFIQRLLPQVNSIYDTKIHRLHRPFRWLENDPIETYFDQLLCAAPKATPDITSQNAGNNAVKFEAHKTQFTWIDKQQLVNNEHLYCAVFGLLQSAHYQTTPNDIVRILDSSDHIVGLTSAFIDNQLIVIGAVVAIIEGGEVLQALSTEISLGNRRVQGQLTPQSLALLLQDEAYATMRYLRITRIAVLHTYRNCQVGTQMLRECLAYAKNKHIDWVSSSFGLNEELLNFWRKSEFTLSKIGNRTDTASGTNSVIVVKQVTKTSAHYLKLIQAKLHIDTQFYAFLYSSTKQTKQEENYLRLLSSPLVKKELTNLVNILNSEEYISIIQKIMQNLLQGRVRFEQASSAVLAFALKDKENNNLATIPQKLVQYNKKGQHKSDKLQVEKEILHLLN